MAKVLEQSDERILLFTMALSLTRSNRRRTLNQQFAITTLC